MTRNQIKRKQNRKGKVKEKAHKPSYTILAITIYMAIFGLTMIYSGSIFTALQAGESQYYFLILQTATIVISLIPAVLIYLWDYRKLSKLSLPTLGVIIVLLIAVLFTPEEAANGSARWFSLGPITIQPSEFLKPVIIVVIASIYGKIEDTFKGQDEGRFFTRAIITGLILLPILILLLLQPDLGTTILVVGTVLIMFYISDTSKMHKMGTFIGSGIFGTIGLLAGILSPYRLARIQTFFKTFLTGEIFDAQGSGFQIKQILIGISQGGFLGKGLFKSTQAKGFLVERTAYTDSTVAVMQEELGYASLVLFVILWLVVLWKGIQISLKAPDKQGQLMAAGLTIYLTLQALLNMGANNITIPLTGIPLPFLTYGGSSILVTMSSFALLLNISKYTNE